MSVHSANIYGVNTEWIRLEYRYYSLLPATHFSIGKQSNSNCRISCVTFRILKMRLLFCLGIQLSVDAQPYSTKREYQEKWCRLSCAVFPCLYFPLFCHTLVGCVCNWRQEVKRVDNRRKPRVCFVGTGRTEASTLHISKRSYYLTFDLGSRGPKYGDVFLPGSDCMYIRRSSPTFQMNHFPLL
jgi:hypothetical protein